MKLKKLILGVLLFCLFMTVCTSIFANNINVSNISLTGRDVTTHTIMVKFDLTWENSWRLEVEPANWDAAWVFVKYRISGGAWQHATINTTGFIAPAGSTISPGSDGTGAFIYRSAIGTGTNTFSSVQLRWNYGNNGVPDNANIDIKVFAIEMVYVPQGSFYIGSGGSEDYTFYKYPNITSPYMIGSEGEIFVGTTNNYLYYEGYGNHSYIPAAFPKGYNSFYCMKYELSQQGYVDFLNNLVPTQAYNRFYPYTGGRYGVVMQSGVYITTHPFIACANLNWGDVAAYLDWSCLRPMTELEYEKSCRGPHAPVPNEYAWGTARIDSSQYTLSDSGAINEKIATNYSTMYGNAAYYTTIYGIINGPLRTGIFAGSPLNTGRVSSGATYYGIMEMSGNLMEYTVAADISYGETFTGLNGNGLLDVNGNGDVYFWPAASGPGMIMRGGSCFSNMIRELRVSNRFYSTYEPNRGYNGCRGVRTAL
jgi:formylglycine-generating enzyme required for sulfatase activity